MALIQDVEVEQYLRDCVNIEPLALNEEFIRLPADVAYWNERYSKAYRGWSTAKVELDRIRAQKNLEIREAAKTGGGKVTEAYVESLIEVDPAYVNSRMTLIEAEVEKTRLYGVLDAIRTKREMLVSLGAQIRQEMAGNPQLRSEMHAQTFRAREEG